MIIEANALTPGVAENPGHVFSEVAPLEPCLSSQILGMENDIWSCLTVSISNEVIWTVLSSLIYRESGGIGIGTSNMPATVSVNESIVSASARFLNANIRCAGGITFNENSFICNAPVADVLTDSMYYSLPIHADVAIATYICGVFSANNYLSSNVEEGSTSGNYAFLDTVQNIDIGESEYLGNWQVMPFGGDWHNFLSSIECNVYT